MNPTNESIGRLRELLEPIRELESRFPQDDSKRQRYMQQSLAYMPECAEFLYRHGETILAALEARELDRQVPAWAVDFELRALDVPISVGRTELEPGVHPKLPASYRTLLKFGGPENQGNTVAFVFGNSSNERESRAMAEKMVAAYNAITPGQSAPQPPAQEQGECMRHECRRVRIEMQAEIDRLRAAGAESRVYWKGEQITTTERLIEVVHAECSAAWDAGNAAGAEDARDADISDLALEQGPDDVPRLTLGGRELAAFPAGTLDKVMDTLSILGGHCVGDSERLDFMDKNRVALIPEFEGPWDVELYEDGQIVAVFSGNDSRSALDAAIASQAKEGEGNG